MARIVVLISGSGTNLQALIDAKLPGDIVHVVSSNASAFGLERAQRAGIPTSVHALKSYYAGIPKEDTAARKAARSTFDADLAAQMLELKADLVVCAGWMLILSPAFLQPLDGKVPIINLHPALPGQFAGTHAIERSWEAGQKGEVDCGGCMVHYVIEQVDMGEPLVVEKVDMIKGETVEAYEARIHAVEHVAIVKGTLLALQK